MRGAHAARMGAHRTARAPPRPRPPSPPARALRPGAALPLVFGAWNCDRGYRAGPPPAAHRGRRRGLRQRTTVMPRVPCAQDGGGGATPPCSLSASARWQARSPPAGRTRSARVRVRRAWGTGSCSSARSGKLSAMPNMPGTSRPRAGARGERRTVRRRERPLLALLEEAPRVRCPLCIYQRHCGHVAALGPVRELEGCRNRSITCVTCGAIGEESENRDHAAAP